MSRQHLAVWRLTPLCAIYSSEFRSDQCLPRLLTGLLVGLVGLVAVTALSGCAHVYQLDNTAARAIYSYDYTDATTHKTVHEAGLVARHLLDSRSFSIYIPQITLVPVGKGVGDLNPSDGLGARCIAGGLKIKAGDKKDDYSVQAELRSPVAYLDSEHATVAKHIEDWTRHCDCSDVEAEISGSCFGRRFAAEALGELRIAAGQPDAELSRDTLDRIVRAVGRPFVPYDRLLMGERGMALPSQNRNLAYLMQRLSPGEELCFHVSSYATTWLPDIAQMGSIAEPAAPACFPWETLTRADYRTDLGAKGEVAIGIDPLGRVGSEWKEEQGELLVGQEQIGNLVVRHRLMTSVDRVSERGDNPFRFAILFTSNRFYLIPNGPERDMDIQPKSVPSPISRPEFNTRGSFLVLMRDARLAAYIRSRVAKPDDTCRNASMASTQKIHRYLKCLTVEWGESEGITITDEQVRSWILDVAYPSNVRPYVRMEISVNGLPEKVRTGSTLLNLIDRRLNLSAQVFDLRQRTKSPDAAETPGELEAQLIGVAIQEVGYERRVGLGFQRIDLRRAQRLEDLLVPLNSGDRVKWR